MTQMTEFELEQAEWERLGLHKLPPVLGLLAYVRIPSMSACGYKDYMGTIEKILDNSVISMCAERNGAYIVLANAQTRCKTQSDFGWFLPGDPQWMCGLNPGDCD